MVRTIVGVMFLIAAVLWLPLWVQLVLCAAAIVVLPYPYLVLLPAIVSDALYAPSMHFSWKSHWMVLIVLGMLIIHWYIMKKVRRQQYGLEA